MVNLKPHHATALLLLALLAGGAAAQTPAAKPADGKTLSLGGGTSGGKLLTRDELRSCMKQRDALATRLGELEAQQKALDPERDLITKDTAVLAAENDEARQKNDALGGLAQRLNAFNLKYDEFQGRVKEFNEAKRTGATADRQRAELMSEQEAMRKQQQDLEAERLALTAAAEAAVNRFNAHAPLVDAKTKDWNQRNARLQDQIQAAGDERQAWVTACGNRRYLETDEDAIRRGK